MSSNPENLQTKEQKDGLSDGLAAATKGGSSFNPDSIKNIRDTAKFLISGAASGGGRQRRSVETPEVTLQTIEQVGCLLGIKKYNTLLEALSSSEHNEFMTESTI